MSLALIVVLILVLGAELVNGWTDAPNAIATTVGTRALRPMQAVVMAGIFNLLGVLSGSAVAATVGKGIVDAASIDLGTVGAAMFAIITWSTLAARRGIPTSETHALVAGLAGAALASGGPEALLSKGWLKVLIGLGLSTVVGFVGGLLAIVAVSWLFRRVDRRRVGGMFRWLQVGSSAFMAFSHGSNDGQKFMGAFALALVLGGVLETFSVPVWVMVLCATVMALGTCLGGWRIIRTLGMKLTHLKTHEGLAAETAAGATITAASLLGIPLSTTHTISTAIMGVGISHGVGAVRWQLARQLVIAWVATFPACAALGFLASSGVEWLQSL